MNNDRRNAVGKKFREYLYHSAVQGKPLMGKELDMAVRANAAISDTKATLIHGSGNQVTDLQASDGKGRMTMGKARKFRDKLSGVNKSHKLGVHSGTMSALSAEVIRGANCGENADLTMHNMMAQEANPSITAQRMTLNPNGTANQSGSSEIDHAFSQLVSSEQETNWVKQDDGKWKDMGQKTVQRKIIADSWITGAHAVRDDDFAFAGVNSGVRYESPVKGNDHMARAKSKFGLSPSVVNKWQQSTESKPHRDFTALQTANGSNNALHLWGNDEATNKTFQQNTTDPLAKRNSMLDSIKGFNKTSLKSAVTNDTTKNDLKRQKVIHQTFAAQGRTGSGRLRSKSVGDTPGPQ